MAEEPDSSENCKVGDSVSLLELSWVGKWAKNFPWGHHEGWGTAWYLSGQREAGQLLHSGGLPGVLADENLPSVQPS